MLEIVFDQADAVRLVSRAEGVVREFPTVLSRELLAALVRESAPASETIAHSWRPIGTHEIETDVDFASFLARGTSAHGPAEAPVMVFESDGELVWAEWVEGVRADPFDERAVAAVTLAAPTSLQASLRMAGL